MLTTTWLKCLEAIMAIWLQMIFWHSFFSDKPFPVRQVPCIEESVLKNLRFIPGMRYAEDYWSSIQLVQRFKCGYLPKILYKYRRHDSNLTNNKEKQEEMEIKVVKSLGIDK